MYLFSSDGKKELEALLKMKTVFAFDFDGTVSKIVESSSKAVVLSHTRQLLSKLAQIAPVAIISSRPSHDLAKRVRINGAHVFPHYGIESLVLPEEARGPLKTSCQEWTDILKAVDFGPGVEIENKLYSVAIHYRHSITKEHVKNTLWKTISKFSLSPRVVRGKSVINLLPKTYPSKETILIKTLNDTNAKALFYLGDDESDEEVFGSSDPRVFGVRIAERGISKARAYMARHEVNQLLQFFVENVVLRNRVG